MQKELIEEANEEGISLNQYLIYIIPQPPAATKMPTAASSQ